MEEKKTRKPLTEEQKKSKYKYMTGYLRGYRKRCKAKTITFYPDENELFEFSQTINFQGEVKEWLKERMKQSQSKK